jgi:hypothetical protein
MRGEDCPYILQSMPGEGRYLGPEPVYCVILCLIEAFDDILVKPFVPDGAVAALDSSVLPGLDVLDGNPFA